MNKYTLGTMGPTPAMDFNCVPHQVVEDLREVGNWKVRAAAVESLHSAVLAVQDAVVLLPTLSELLEFLMSLVADPNFKVSISAMRILQDLLIKLGTSIQPYLGTVMATLIVKLGDRNETVRHATLTLLAAFMRTLGPQPILNALGGTFVHPEWRVREKGVIVVLQALLSHGPDRFNYPTIVRVCVEGLLDDSERVQVVSLEGLALLQERLGPLLQGLLTTVGAPDVVKHQVSDRIKAQLPLPYLNTDGLVELQPHARPASAGKPKPAQGGAGANTSTPTVGRSSSASKPEQAGHDTVLLLPVSLLDSGILMDTHSGPIAVVAPPPTADVRSAADVDLHVGENQLQQHDTLALQQMPAPQPGSKDMQLWPGHMSGLTGAVADGVTYLPTPPEAGFSSTVNCDLNLEQAPSSFVQPAEAGTSQQLVLDRYPSFSSCGSSIGGGYSPDAAGLQAGDLVEGSGESLLKWVRPNRGSTQSFSGRQLRSVGSANLSPGRQAGQARAGSSLQPPARVHSHTNDYSTMVARQHNPQAAGMASSLRLSLAASSPAPVASGSPYQPDLYSSMAALPLPGSGATSSRSSLADNGIALPQHDGNGTLLAPIQHYRPSGASSLSSASARSWQGHAELLGEPHPPHGTTMGAPQESDSHAEARADSLLLWRLPTRPAASGRKGSDSSPKATAQPPSGLQQGGSSAINGQGTGSGILHKLDGLKKKLFRSEVPATPTMQQQLAAQQGASGGPWSIPAVHAEAQMLASRPSSRLAEVKQPAEKVVDTQAAESPARGSARQSLLSLKRRQQEAAQNRRVWSAPSGAPSQRATMHGPEDASVLPPAVTEQGSSGTESGAIPAPASPARPGLQALKVRARTARMATPSFSQPQPASPSYGMDVLTDVFGPDRAAVATAWSPARQGPIPSRVTLATRGGGSSWPQAPVSPGSMSSGSPSAIKRLGTGFLQRLGSGSSPGTADPGAAAYTPSVVDLTPLEDPEGTMRQLLQALEHANMSQKKELDWQSQYEALNNARRIIQNHASVMLPVLHPFVLAAAPVMDSLRSIPARLAITVFQELIEALGPALDSELDHLVPILVKKAGVVSVAGRDNFLAVEADRALTLLVATGSEIKMAVSLLSCLGMSKATDMKAKVAMHLDACVQRHGHRLVMNGPLVTRLLRAAVSFLDEGAQEARTSGKRILWEVRRLMDVSLGPEEFRKILGRLEMKTEKVWDIFDQGRPPPPAVRTQPSARSPGSSSPATPSFQAGSPGAGGSRPSVLATATLGYPVLSGEQYSSYHVMGSASPAAGGGTRPSVLGPRLALSLKQMTLGGEGGMLGGESFAGSPAASPTKAASGAPMRRAGARSAGASKATAQAAASTTAAASSMDPGLLQQVDSMLLQLPSKDYKERTAALATLRELIPRLSSLTLDMQLRILSDDLAQRLTDANLKVQQAALEVIREVFQGAAGPEGLGTAGINTLLPSLSRALDSSNGTARGLAAEALDALILSCRDASVYIQPYMQALAASSNIRSKAVLLDRLAGLLPALCSARQPMVTRYVVPPLLAALGDKRQEVKGPLQAVLVVLASCMGVELLDACMSQTPAHRLYISELVAAQQQQQ